MPWNRVRGHESLRLAFQEVVQKDRLAHAYLFIGPSGVGKALFARELAKALLCLNRQEAQLSACDECASCRQIEAGSHRDFIHARRPEESLEFPIALMREVCQRFTMKSSLGRGNFAIIEDADDLNEESANCFLKTLEEPPPRSMIVLISTSADRQLSTIVSRCQTVRFSPLSDELVRDILGEQGHDAEMIERLIPLAEGSPGQALALADPELWEFRQRWIQQLLSKPVQSAQAAKEWTQFVEAAGKEAAAQRRRASQCLALLVSFLRQTLHLSLGREPAKEANQEIRAMQALSTRLSLDVLMNLIERALKTDMHIDRRVQLVLALEALMDALGQQLK